MSSGSREDVRPSSASDDGAAWRGALLDSGSTIQDAIRSLERSALQIVLVVDEHQVLAGTITDGDIRRGLLRGLGLESPIDEIIHRNAMVVPPEMGREWVSNIMHANKLRQLPIVDGDRRLLGLHLWDALAATPERSNVMVVMAGGEGRRLRPMTEKCPKPMLPVGGKPILEHILERAKGEGFRNFVFAVCYLGEVIEEHFGDGSRWGVRIDYTREEDGLGTAGALGLIEIPLEQSVVVTNGDVLTDIRYGELLDYHALHKADATMAVRPYEWQHPFGVVRTDGIDIVGFEEKPILRTHVNAGVYALEPAALKLLRPNERCDMPALFDRVIERRGRVVAYAMHEPWLDVGRPEDYRGAMDGQR
jgi:dTDP-glucose pyrophosphorylase/CBS domain-containing protein